MSTDLDSVDTRQTKIEGLQQFIHGSEEVIASIFDQLNWNPDFAIDGEKVSILKPEVSFANDANASRSNPAALEHDLTVDLVEEWRKSFDEGQQCEDDDKYVAMSLERDAKRRRRSYKKKSVYTNGKTYTEVLKEVIEGQCHSLANRIWDSNLEEKIHDSRKKALENESKKCEDRTEKRRHKSHKSKEREHKHNDSNKRRRSETHRHHHHHDSGRHRKRSKHRD